MPEPIGYEPGTGIPIYAPVTLSRLAFRWRYTMAEQAAIHDAEMNHTDATVRATLAVLRMSMQEATDIDVTDPRTIAGVEYHEAVGLIAEARVAEILAPPT